MDPIQLMLDFRARSDVFSATDPIWQQGDADPFGFHNYVSQVMFTKGDRTCLRQNMNIKANAPVWASATVAFFEGSEAFPDVTSRAFLKWILSQYSGAPTQFKGLLIHHIDEVVSTAIFSRLEGDPLARKFYFVSMGSAPVEIPDGAGELAALEYNIRPDGYRKV